MTWRLYRILIRMHPREFRERFGDEMELIFEEAASVCGKTELFFDAAVSLHRQWFLRPVAWKWAAATLGGMLSLFCGFGGFLTWAGIWAAVRACF
jgi:hypothetical protein